MTVGLRDRVAMQAMTALAHEQPPPEPNETLTIKRQQDLYTDWCSLIAGKSYVLADIMLSIRKHNLLAFKEET